YLENCDKLAERLNLKRDDTTDDIISQGDIVFYK
ncbi:hypothetical protein WEZ65_10765, partial [Staphylococcus aureus]